MLTTLTAFAADPGLKKLSGHLPKLPAGLAPKGPLSATNRLRLAIGLPLRDPKGLDDFLAQLYNPASPNYRRYLTPDEFTERFGPSPEDYRKVRAFARDHGLAETATQPNRLLLDVEGPVRNIEAAFHINLLTYRHPSEGRDFFAPDTDPSVDAQMPISDISGLNNYALPRPKYHRQDVSANATPRSGSGSGGTYFGRDFRAAYLPGVTLTGAGQMVGVLAFDGLYPDDITAYANAAGLPNVTIQIVLLDGYDGTPSTGANSGNGEVSLDVEMALCMAPGLSRIVVFEAGPSGLENDVLSAMAASSQIKQLTCSWGWPGGPSTTTDNIFKQMATQGQSFLNASGDSDAFTTGVTSVNGVDNTNLFGAPSSSPYITQVGGTTLTTTGPLGSWASETVWNWNYHSGSYVGSSGGISSYYSIPAWQVGVNMTANGGSITFRNIPDVALTADNVYVCYGNGAEQTVGGTSCAAPLWAGLTALINQQAVGAGLPTVGFLNPAFYALGSSGAYRSSFHDTTTGNNFWPSSPSQFAATIGYDLCTGWGTPAGQGLIDSLAGPANPLSILPVTGAASFGPPGGPFSPGTASLLLTNASASAVTWSLVNTSSWLSVSVTNGTLPAASRVQLAPTVTGIAHSLKPGTYPTSLRVSNQTGLVFTCPLTLMVAQSVLQNGDFELGDFGGWTLVGNTVGSGYIYNAVQSTNSGFTVAHSGGFGAFLGDSQIASLSQSVSTVPGQYYLLSLWLNNTTNGTPQSFSLNWNTNATTTNTLFHLLNPQIFSWTNLQFVVGATASNSTLQIQAENPPNYFGVDDVTVTPVPFPHLQSPAQAGPSLQLSWLSATGLTYQVQFKSNVLQANWVNLGKSVVATNYNSIILDTNILIASPRRFYRLQSPP